MRESFSKEGFSAPPGTGRLLGVKQEVQAVLEVWVLPLTPLSPRQNRGLVHTEVVAH